MSIELPVVLRRLVDAGLWKSEDAHEDARIPRSVARRWDPEAGGIHLEDPQPLASLASSSTFFREYGALDLIQVHSCFLIADFGIGSDSPIIVNVEHKGLPVSYLYWTVKGYKNGITEWRPITDLGSFVADIFPDGPSRPPFRRASSIEVNGARYYWRSSFGADDLTVLVQHVSGIGQQVEAQWVRPPRTARNLPKSVKELINHALAQGWTPQVAAPALRLTAMDSVITIDTF